MRAPRAITKQARTTLAGNPSMTASGATIAAFGAVGSSPAGPDAFISPHGGSFSSTTVAVNIYFEGDTQLDDGTLYIALNGGSVTNDFTYTPDDNYSGTASGTITLSLGENVLTVRMHDVFLQKAVDTARFTYEVPPPPTYAVTVTPDSADWIVGAGAGSAVTFRVHNDGDQTTTYGVQASCTSMSGNMFPSGCFAFPTSQALAPGASFSAYVAWMAGASGTMGRIKLTATQQSPSGTAKDSGSVYVAAHTFHKDSAIIDLASVNPETAVTRERCLTIALDDESDWECGDLRVVHALPTARTMGHSRTPVLLYNSRFVRPKPVVYVNVVQAETTTPPDTVVAVLEMAGVTKDSVKLAGGAFWPGKTARIGFGFDAPSYLTGVYPYTVVVQNRYNSGGVVKPSTKSGTLIVVNRSESPFGSGWWLAGLEQLYFPAGDTTSRLWVGGDGSARLYSKVASGKWVAPRVDRPDTLAWNGSRYVRYLPHKVRVEFDAAGRHVATVNRLNQTTTFHYDASGTLDTLRLPLGSGSGPYYALEYSGSAIRVLDSVSAPGASSNKRRQVSMVHDGRELRSITELPGRPESGTVSYSYNVNVPGLMTKHTDRRGTTTEFIYSNIQRLRMSHRNVAFNGGSGFDTADIVMQISTADSAFFSGSGHSIPAESAYVRLDGPRDPSDVHDVTRFWLDRFGQPVQIENALGQVTTIEAGTPESGTAWPALATSIRYPNGRQVEATYDTRGNLASTTDLSTFTGSGANKTYATTSYDWNDDFDFIEQITRPLDEVVSFGYDSTDGNRLWEQTGTSSTRRVNYSYYSTGSSAGLLATVKTPLSTHRDSVYYDALGNVARTVTPSGLRSWYYKDALGRDTLVFSPIDSLQTDSGYVHVAYDDRDRDTLTVSFGPATTGYGSSTVNSQMLTVRKFYDVQGNLDSLKRSSSPDPNGIGTLTTRWKYDLANRKVKETPPGRLFSGQLRSDSLMYDQAGNQTSWITRRGYEIRMRYDALNRLIERIVPTTTQPGRDTVPMGTGWQYFPRYPSNGPMVIPADTSVFAYDETGNMVRADNRDARVRRGYNANGTLAVDTLMIRTWAPLDDGGGFDTHVYVLRFGYDLEGRRSWVEHPLQLAPRYHLSTVAYDSVAYDYDPVTGSLASVRDVLGNTFNYYYDLEGRLDSLALPGPGGIKYHYGEDGELRRRLERLVGFSGTAGDTLHDESLAYDGRGKVVQVLTPGDSTRMRYAGLGAVVLSQSWSRRDVPVEQSFEEWRQDAMGHTQWYAPNRMYYPNNRVTSHYTAGTEQLDSASNGQSISVFLYDEGYYDADGNRWLAGHSNYDGSVFGITLSYYRADNQLRVADKRVCDSYSTGGCKPPASVNSAVAGAFEEYRYDALGRRVLVRTRRDSTCGGGPTARKYACQSTIQRTVWDGDQVLYEIRMPGADTASVALMESDTVSLNTALAPYGRVAYTHGLGLDEPLDLIRIGYGIGVDVDTVPDVFRLITLVPRRNWRGLPDMATDEDGTRDGNICSPITGGGQHCLQIDWPAENMTVFYAQPNSIIKEWFGNLVQEGRDGVGTLYKRNRYYDPNTGNFTQEDPIGLAGGMNLYGFAGGDPVNYSDPFGLRPLRDSEREGLGDFCKKIDCDKVDIHDGMDIDSKNAWRGVVLGAAGDGTLAVTLGYDIYVAKSGMNGKGDVSNSVLVHELTHVGQYEANKSTYYAKGFWNQVIKSALFGKNVYATPRPYSKSFEDYGMEQQAVIVERCMAGGEAAACAISPYQPH